MSKIHIIATFRTVIDIIRFVGKLDIVNKKRQDAFKRAIEEIEDIVEEDIKDLNVGEKIKQKINEILKNGFLQLEDKDPYNGLKIVAGKIINDDEFSEILQSFQNLSILSGKGIGIGDAALKELIVMGYTHIEELEEIYDTNKFENFRKGLKNPLCKYFQGLLSTKMPRSEATKWKETIDEVLAKIANNCQFSIAGSYARRTEVLAAKPRLIKRTEGTSGEAVPEQSERLSERRTEVLAAKPRLIGDIDYVIVNKEQDQLYETMITLMEEMSTVVEIGRETVTKVSFDSIQQIPKKPKDLKNILMTLKMWFKTENGLKTKLEFYGYSNSEFCFPYYSRITEVEIQKKMKMQAAKKGLILSPFGMISKNTGEIVDLGIKTVEDIYTYLEN